MATHSSRIAAVFCNARVVTRVLSTKGRAIARLSASRRRPRLCDASLRQMWRITLEDLRDGSKPGVAEVVAKRPEHAECGTVIAGQSKAGLSVRPQQPAPDRSLVVGTIA